MINVQLKNVIAPMNAIKKLIILEPYFLVLFSFC